MGPEPWAYMKHLRFSTSLWLGMLPLAFLPSMLYTTPVVTTALGYVVFKLDDISIELQSPFGGDKSDIGICLLGDTLQRELHVMMLAYTRRYELPADMKVPQNVVDEEAD